MSEDSDIQQLEHDPWPPRTPPGQSTPPPAAPPVRANTSGTGGPVPDEIKGWNWGAFWLTWIWGISHRVWISLVWFPCIPMGIVSVLLWHVVLGLEGSKMAWHKRQFDSIEHFRRVQARWYVWGWIVGPICLLLYALPFLLITAWFILELLGETGS